MLTGSLSYSGSPIEHHHYLKPGIFSDFFPNIRRTVWDGRTNCNSFVSETPVNRLRHREEQILFTFPVDVREWEEVGVT